MCNIPKTRLLPRGATNGQIAVWNAAQNRWVAQDNLVGPGGSFDAASNQNITGNWQFGKPILQREFTDALVAPGEGYYLYSSGPTLIKKLFSTGYTTTENYDLLSNSQEYRYPNESGTIALRDPSMLRAQDSVNPNFKTVYDNNGYAFDLKLFTNGKGVLSSRFNLEYDNHYINYYGIYTFENEPNFAYSHGSGIVTTTSNRCIYKLDGGLNNFEINNANSYIGLGHNAPIQFGVALLNTRAANGVYFNATSGFQNDWVNYSYTLNSQNHIYNGVLNGSSFINAGMLNLGTHTFGIQHASANAVSYRGISLGYTINNTVTSTGFASGIRIDAIITNANGMLHRGIYYGVGGVASNTTIRGIELINSDAATSGNQRLSPSLYLQGSGWKTASIAASQTVAYDIFVNPQQAGTIPFPQLNFDVLINGVRNTILTLGGPNGIVLTAGGFPGVSGNLQLGNISLVASSNICQINVFGSTLTGGHFVVTSTNALTATLGNVIGMLPSLNFTPSSGTATFSAFAYNGTINQTGGANGITRGALVNPTLTAAADFRAYEAIVRNNHSDKALLLSNGASDLFVVYGGGRIKAGALPTASAGLGSREFWIDGNTIKITD